MDDNTITISGGSKSKPNTFSIFSHIKFFQCKEVIVKVEYNAISITKPTLDYMGKTCKVYQNNKNEHVRQFSITSNQLRKGKYQIDKEESTEDELIIQIT